LKIQKNYWKNILQNLFIQSKIIEHSVKYTILQIAIEFTYLTNYEALTVPVIKDLEYITNNW
jgi:hypothetical protein